MAVVCIIEIQKEREKNSKVFSFSLRKTVIGCTDALLMSPETVTDTPSGCFSTALSRVGLVLTGTEMNLMNPVASEDRLQSVSLPHAP